MDKVFSLILVTGWLLLPVSASHAATCKPTEPDMLGPFYKPNAPERTSVGKGYILEGTVRWSTDCLPVQGAVIEFWLTGPDGNYDEAHRARVITDAEGRYRFESNKPGPYAGRPPHIHIRVSAPGAETLVTQHYPGAGKKHSIFDLVLVPGPRS